MNTKSAGIWQGDIIIRTGLIQGLRELRKNPDLLDYCFASLPQDQLTADTYGQASVEKAKQWFINTEIPVRLNVAMNSPKLPCISVELRDSGEAEATLADIHHDPSEAVEVSPWLPITPTFAATQYDPDTGNIKLPKKITDSTLIFPGMVVVDKGGFVHEILEAVDESTIKIKPAVADFSQCVLKYAQPQNIASLESLSFRGTYGIGCHAQGEAEVLIWLRSIVEFVLLRYKQSYFEARGFERSTYTVTGLVRDPQWGVENVFTQFINLTGYYRNYWPKTIAVKTQGIVTQPIKIAGGGQSPGSIDLDDPAWNMEDDILSGIPVLGIKGSIE